MKKLEKIFNMKFVIISVLMIFMIISIVWTLIEKKNKEEFELKKQAIKNNEIDGYCSGKKCDLDDYITYCKWNKDDITGIELGLEKDGERMAYYYFEDDNIVEQALGIFEDTVFLGVNSGDIINTEVSGFEKWEVILHKDGEEYSIRILGYESKYDNVNVVKIDTAYAAYRTSGSLRYPECYWLMECDRALVKEDIYKKVLEIYEDNVNKITVAQLESLRESKSVNPLDYAIYMHTFEEDINYYDENNETRVIWLLKFPIENTDCYFELQKYNEGAHKTMDGVITKPALHDIISVEVCNNEGEKLDLFQCSKEELEEFLQQGE